MVKPILLANRAGRYEVYVYVCKSWIYWSRQHGRCSYKRHHEGDTDKKYQMFACDINRKALDKLAAETGIMPCKDAIELVNVSDIVFIAVKPRYAKAVLEEIRDVLGNKILVSIVVGLPISWYKHILGNNARVVRTMPNTPALVGRE